jgi:hypothetical protein
MIEDIINPTPARQLINDFYYQLPNNGFLKEGLLSCERRYNEAIICALVCIDKMITIAPWGGVIDNEVEDGSKEYYIKIKEELIQIQNDQMEIQTGG